MDTPIPQQAAAQSFSIKRVFVVSLISSLTLSALVAIFLFLFGDFGDTEARVLFTTLAIGGYSLAGLCCSVLYDKGRYQGFALLGIVVAVLGFLFTVGAIWEFLELDSIWKPFLIFMILSVGMAHASLLFLAESEKPLVNFLLYATVVCIVVVAALLIGLVVLNFDNIELMYYRLLGVFAVLDVLGTVVVPIVRKVVR